ncbi:diaminopimelate epimerase [Candidatus Pelagibacter sp.]|jgi:diaminopimelate epimerase|nr:diaminopimelate epimerase [Candidatus Pelagibacter sp.]
MEFKAFKMDGLGNDFVIIDQRHNHIELTNDQIKKICNRNFIGCDQLIFIKKNEKIDADMEFYNSDGSISGACGNGTRCVAYLLSKETNKNKIILGTESGNLESRILNKRLVETKIGPAKTDWNEIPLLEKLNTINLNYKIIDNNNNEYFGGTAVNVGNPHVVFFVDNIEDFNLEKIGPEIENNKLFPEKCNVTLANIINESLIKVKVWERGAGLTKACGTAACATAYAAKINGKIKNKTEIEFELGKLLILIDDSENISMTGPVSNIDHINIKI